MAFTTRRGRPPKATPAHDPGTPELRFKHAHGLTAEPIDRCLSGGVITAAHHWCGLHLRWLYTLRYGAPHLTTRYDFHPDTPPRTADDATWRRQREAEYHAATALLRHHGHYEAVMRLCVFNEHPIFLSPVLRERAWNDAALALRLERTRIACVDGLALLVLHWRRPPVAEPLKCS